MAAVLVTMALSGTAVAQEGPDARRNRPPRDEVFKMVDAYMVSNLQEGLGLSDAEFVKLLPLVKRLQTDRRDAAQRRVKALQELRKLLQPGGATEAQVATLLKDVKAAEADEAAVVRRDRDAIDATLNVVQQAKFRVMEAQVEHRLRELMTEMRARQGHRQGGAGRRPREQD